MIFFMVVSLTYRDDDDGRKKNKKNTTPAILRRLMLITPGQEGVIPREGCHEKGHDLLRYALSCFGHVKVRVR